MHSKNFFKIILTFYIIFLLLFNLNLVLADDIDIDDDTSNVIAETLATSSKNVSELNLNARSCIILDRKTNTIMYGKNENSKVKMASTTKIMTATVIIENCDLNQTIEVSKKAAGTGGSRLGLKSGDKITIRDLLYGLLLCSGNDAAVALAETAGGSVQGFAEMMNSKATNLGLLNSHFESPHGLDSTNHYTTAYELALLTNYALKNSTFASIVSTKNYTVTINGYPKNLTNTNELLGALNGVYGVKTGFTNGANRCLVTACKRGDMDIICVVLGCDTKKFRTSDSVKLIEYAFKNFEYINLSEIVKKKFEEWKSENNDFFYVYKGVNSNLEINYKPLEKDTIPILKTNIDSIKVTFDINNYFNAPITSDTLVGSLTVDCGNGLSYSSNVFATNDIPKKDVLDYFFSLIKHLSLILFNT